MELEDLKRAVHSVNPAAILVQPRILRRILQAEFKVPALLMHAPHERCYSCDRQVIFRNVEQDELDLEPDRLLPPTVILLARPTAEDLQSLDRETLLLDYWRLLFHAEVHLALGELIQDGRLGPAQVAARIATIGQTEFEEIRGVLGQENHLLTPDDNLSVYVEFAALYLELRYFAGNLRATYFPALRNLETIDALLSKDVDGDSIFQATRLPQAPLPVVRTDTSSDESHDYYWKVLRYAQRARSEGDDVRAAILHTKAARVAPANRTHLTRAEAVKDLDKLVQRLRDALDFGADRIADWLQDLPSLLDKADQGNRPVEAKLLYDLQKAAVEQERKLFALDVVEWALSAGRRPIKRPLASVQMVRTTKHLRSAGQRLTMARVSDEERQRLAKLFQEAQHLSENHLRERFWPILFEAFYDVGLVAANPPEQVALEKTVEELLDRITERGFVTFSDLRDTLSRNQLKLPDLADPHDYWRGDPLLRLDRRLSTLLEGVYRHGEFYLRWLESMSSLFFGTAAGRFFTLNIAVPFGGAWVLVEMIVSFFIAPLQEHYDQVAVSPSDPPVLLGAFLLGTFLLALIHLPPLRAWIAEALAQSYWASRLLFYDMPLSLWAMPWLRRFLQSWPSMLLYWYGIKPLAITGLFWLWKPGLFSHQITALALFLVVNLVLNSRFGYGMSEAVTEMILWAYGWLRFDFLQGLFRFVLLFFKRVTATMEYLFYTVDEWLRFRSDEGRITMGLRAVTGVLWFPVGYALRLYFIMLIEPTVNPLKYPLSSLGYKFLLLWPWYRSMTVPPFDGSEEMSALLGKHLGELVASAATIALIPTLWLLPSAFAFFFWEMQENWRLFRANRPRKLRPVVIGRRGEKVLQLLKPGFHSGTIPHLFAHLREAERAAYRTGNWRSARTDRQALQEVARSIQLFVEREFIAILEQSGSWPNQPVTVGQILLSCNQIRIELRHASYPEKVVELALEERSGWLLGSLQESGWLRQLSVEARQVMTSALAGLYKLAGVDLVREQLAAILDGDSAGGGGQLVVRTPETPDRGSTHTPSAVAEVQNGLGDDRNWLLPILLNGGRRRLPVRDRRRLFFSQLPITWEQWVECWEQDNAGRGHPRLLPEGVTLIRTEASRAEVNQAG
jgi:hypothetical protein